MTQDDINRAEWENRANWTLFCYNSSKDSRVFVPKRSGIGWTINFGHPNGKVVFGSLMAMPAIIFFVLFFAWRLKR